MQLSDCHKMLDKNGIGRCSVPMWMMGIPAGFCDEPAYGEQEPNQYRYDGYCGGLACFTHGGPQSRVFMDGNEYCAVMPDFINLMESPAGFGKTPKEARANLQLQGA